MMKGQGQIVEPVRQCCPHVDKRGLGITTFPKLFSEQELLASVECSLSACVYKCTYILIIRRFLFVQILFCNFGTGTDLRSLFILFDDLKFCICTFVAANSISLSTRKLKMVAVGCLLTYCHCMMSARLYFINQDYTSTSPLHNGSCLKTLRVESWNT